MGFPEARICVCVKEDVHIHLKDCWRIDYVSKHLTWCLALVETVSRTVTITIRGQSKTLWELTNPSGASYNSKTGLIRPEAASGSVFKMYNWQTREEYSMPSN